MYGAKNENLKFDLMVSRVNLPFYHGKLWNEEMLKFLGIV